MGDNARLAELTRPFIEALGGKVDGADLVQVIALVKDRANTLKEVAQAALLFYRGEPQADAALKAEHLTPEIQPALKALAAQLGALPEWKREAIGATFKAVLAEFGLKMPKLAMPVRLLVAGQLQTPPSMPCWSCSAARLCCAALRLAWTRKKLRKVPGRGLRSGREFAIISFSLQRGQRPSGRSGKYPVADSQICESRAGKVRRELAKIGVDI